MPTIPALTTFTANTKAKAAEVNANFSAIRTTVNSYAAFKDQAETITAPWSLDDATLSDPTLTGTVTATGATISGGTLAPTVLTVPSGTTLPSPTLTGTLSGGTVAPTTLTIPSGVTIPTHTETGTITATGSTRNGGTLSGATLNNATFTGTVTGLNQFPTVPYSSSTGTTSIPLAATQYHTISFSTAGTYYVTHHVLFYFAGTGTGEVFCSFANAGGVFTSVDINIGYVGGPSGTKLSYVASGVVTIPGAATLGFTAARTGAVGSTADAWYARTYAIRIA